ncbi:MAG TPA: hypothetical protein V6D12_19210 [Candidatus Obscuribacterales bacterium]
MRELPAAFQSIQANSTHVNGHQKAPPAKPFTSKCNKMSQEILQQRLVNGLKSLDVQAERLNQLSNELEAAMIELKAIATDVNRDLRAVQATGQACFVSKICEFVADVVPYVVQKPSGSLVLILRPVDLFKPEREAALIAQFLRRLGSRKRAS